MKESSYIQIKNYFESLVLQSTFLNDFVGFFEREWNSKKASVKGLKSPTLALFKYKLGFDGPHENSLAVRKIGFAIMFNGIKTGDLEGQYSAIDLAEHLAVKVLSRIRIDSADPEHFLYNSLLKDSVEINPVELSSNDFGVDVIFNIKNKQILKLDPADWKDMNYLCK